MVLSAHGIRRSQFAIAKALRMTRHGIRTGPLAQYFLEQGFGVTLFYFCRGMRPLIKGRREHNAVLNGLAQKPTSLACKGDIKDWKGDSRLLRRFMEAGGDLRLQPVQARHIDHALKRGWPPIVNINPRLLDSYGSTDSGHYVVPVHMTEWDSQVSRPRIFYFDPASGTEQMRSVDEFMHACHLWYGAAIFPYPKDETPDLGL